MGAIAVALDFAAPTPQDRALRGLWRQPLQIWQADEPAQVLAVLAAVERAAAQGLWCVGYLRYEAASALDSAWPHRSADGPLAWFAAVPAPGHADSQPLQSDWPNETQEPAPWAVWEPGWSRAEFDAAVQGIHAAIAQGRCYQINLTQRLRGRLHAGSPWALYQALRRAQPGGYAAYIDSGGEQLLSVSPELFFHWDGQRLLTRPMKGTAPRGINAQADMDQADALRRSPKERAENVMIVDLLRNDVSRIAIPGSVRVPRLFHCEALPTVWQMTSDVEARTRPGTALIDVMRALFPCGSITGAPKREAMRLIQAWEPDGRGPYCGAIGLVRPAETAGQIQATFNVAIRTVVARPRPDGTHDLQCGIGSGITIDAQAEGEWREWRHKRAFLDRASQPFDLLETLALCDGVFRHEHAHLQRMARAAAHFGYRWSMPLAQQALMQVAQQHPQGHWRVRLLCTASGQCRAQAFPLAPTSVPVRLRLAIQPLQAADSEFVRFKTTRRSHYEAFEPQDPTVFDTILWNTRGELTECTRGNIALRMGGRWLTPALSAGLLDGVGRQQALASGKLTEAVLRREDLGRAEALAFLNSLRGWLPAVLAESS
jgi:para-aminobenzoate synthetase/4-amino-4-deoxychorismate lyase